MREVKFTKAAPGACPSYGEYYIQDRPYGRDIHGEISMETSAINMRYTERGVSRLCGDFVLGSKHINT